MNKEEFRASLCQKIPLGDRQTWAETNLFMWWNEARKEDSYLTWELFTVTFGNT